MPLLTAAELIDRHDARNLRQRLLDDGSDALEVDLTDESTTAGRRVRAAIDDAEGWFISAVTVGARYSVQDMLTVAEAGTSHSAKTIKRIVADLAFGNLLKRRSLPAADFQALAPFYEEAMGFCEQLRRGDRVFPDVAGVPNAGLPQINSNIPRFGFEVPSLWSQEVRLFGDIYRPPFGPGRC